MPRRFASRKTLSARPGRIMRKVNSLAVRPDVKPVSAFADHVEKTKA